MRNGVRRKSGSSDAGVCFGFARRSQQGGACAELMIIARIFSGLGNQMFQYAAGKRLSLLRNTELKLDTSPCDAWYIKLVDRVIGAKHRDYGLAVFNIDVDFASPAEVWRMRRKHLVYLMQKPMRRLYGGRRCFSRPVVFTDRQAYRHDPRIDECGEDALLFGFWQNEKYFEAIADVLRDDFSFRWKVDPQNEQWIERIQGGNSVGVHVRRGDYESSTILNRTFGLCSIDYYLRGVRFVAERIAHPVFYVFSDDPDWAEKNLDLGYPTYFVRHNNEGKDHEDLRLMSNCKHNIIANSTFGWWAAWLNGNESKIVIAPERWQQKHSQASSIIPSRWVRL